ncbi:MAG: M23 family metallopeptidase [Bacteroidales bacterium OttesenSCG-928-I14]|jgi:septal ring factor EnvC (AmiA/AmiB activator)|nr:M23 family metallopeptidase [Bacteroidales bacterium OttesenSCG-928-I14]
MRIWWIIISLLLLFSYAVQAQAVNSIKELKKQSKILANDIENTNKLINKNLKSIHDMSQNLDSIIKEINKTQKSIIILKKKINISDNKICDKKIQIDQLEKTLKLKKIYYSVYAKKIYKIKNSQNQLFFTLLKNNSTQFSTKILYFKEYSKLIEIQIKKNIDKLNMTTAEKQNLGHDKQIMKTLIDIKIKEEKELQIQKKIRNDNIKNLHKNILKFQIQINDKKKQTKTIEEDIKKIIIEQSKARQRIKSINKIKSECKKNKIKSECKKNKGWNLSPHSIVKIKEKFSFPISGEYQIISHFGHQQYKNMKNIQHDNNGIDIKIDKATNAKSIFDGIITNIFSFTECQNSIMVRHGSYIALYSFLDQIFVKKGERVKTGQNIGTVYTDQKKGNLTILHFELWEENVKLNPELWLSL